ncbi:hypothetical protein SRS16CHR_03591 [Variovorax sp. SRS16]|uniref:hypothetical protein n=1 Tax=Variovorax sp. SRS16 TaxID=282217 RepID=UPI0013183738|nr:hypothetical protein [Variovorax sp. SRS16]VTU25094.1 hypothetical protein SRS16CHR_03591 [Variovorax sp. SRS16]
MSYERNARWLAALVRGEADPLAVDVAGRLALLRAQHAGRGDAGMMDLLARAAEVHAAADRARDVAFLNSLVDGSADYFADDLYDRLAPLHEKYQGDAAMLDLFNRAATAYGNVAMAAAEWALAGLEMQDAIDKAAGRERWD